MNKDNINLMMSSVYVHEILWGATMDTGFACYFSLGRRRSSSYWMRCNYGFIAKVKGENQFIQGYYPSCSITLV